MQLVAQSIICYNNFVYKKMVKKSLNILQISNEDGCFDLQFRKDTRHERTNSPTYYRWKAQFIITNPKSSKNILEKIKKEFGCGMVNISKGQARYSVQKIDEISQTVLPYFRKHSLEQSKRKHFMLWAKAVEIIGRNKGTNLVEWKKTDVFSLIEIHKSLAKHKHNPRKAKWMDMAKSFTK